MFSFSWTLELDIRADLLSRFDGLHFDASIFYYLPVKWILLKVLMIFKVLGLKKMILKRKATMRLEARGIVSQPHHMGLLAFQGNSRHFI